MNVQHIARRFVRGSWGGTESAVLSLAQQLQARGHESTILTSMALATGAQETIAGVPVHRFNHVYPYLGLSGEARTQLDMRAGNLFSFPLLLHMVRSAPPDIYHLHTGKRMGGIVRTAARHHRRPYIVSLHGGVVDVPNAERQRWTEPTAGTYEWGRALGAVVGARRVLQDASAVLCVNRSEQLALQQRMPDQHVVWTPNTVDVQRYSKGCGTRFRQAHGLPLDAYVVLHVARIDEQKNQMEAVEIFDRLAARQPKAWLVFAGPSTNPEYKSRLEARIEASPAAARIRCLGNVDAGSPSLVDMYRAANVLLLTSVHEPFGIVLLEAWAAGLPIVATRVGGVPSFVGHERNGRLYSPGDVDAAVEAVSCLLRDRGYAAELTRQASQDVLMFDVRRSAETMIELYEEVQREYSLRA